MGRKPCCSKEGLNRGAWTAMEDKILTDYIKISGEGQWRNLPKNAGLKRCGKSCRLRWLNYLRPDIKRGNITADEEELIIRLHKLLGNRWSLIAGRLPGRTDNEIKNYWNTNIGKKLLAATGGQQSSNRRQSNQSKKKAKPTIKTSLIRQPFKANSSSTSCVIRTKATRCKKVFIDWPARPAEPQLDQDSSTKPSPPPQAAAAAEPESSEHVPKEEQLRVDDPLNFMVDLDFDGNFLSEFLNSKEISDQQGQYSSANSDDDNSLLFSDNKMMQDLDFTSMASLLEFELDWLQDHQVD